MAISTRLSFKPEWVAERSNDFTCKRCGEEFRIGVVDVYRLWVLGYRDDKAISGTKTDTVICENCYDDVKLERHGD
jgi:hypothetical protein